MGENGYREFVKRFEDVCAKYAEKTAITYMRDDGSKTLFKFGEIYNRVQAAKEQFAAVELRPGDRAAIIAPHSPFAVMAGLSLAYSNITSVLIDASLPGEEINRLLEFSDVRAVFTVPSIYRNIDKELVSDIPVFNLSNENEEYRLFENSVQKTAKTATTDPHLDVIAILFSSGTTASVKGVMITYYSVFKSQELYLINSGLKSNMSYLHVLPFTHIAGYSSAYQYLLTGCEIGLIENIDPTKFSIGLLNFKPDYFAMVPKIYEVIEQKIRQSIKDKGIKTEKSFCAMLSVSRFFRKNLGINIGQKLFKSVNIQVFGGRMHGLGTGSVSCKDSTAQFYLDLGYKWANFYATTETNVPTVSTGILDRYPVGTVGNVKRYNSIDIKIADPDERSIGEIRVKTVLIMKGYFRDPELTAAAFDDDGCFKTGDLGYIDKKGYLHVTGRIKETILLHTGKKVAPTDVDALYGAVCTDIALASCGVPDRNGMFDEIHLFLESGELSEDEQKKIKQAIMDFSGQTSTIYQVSAVHFIDKLPTTSVGKVKRFKLKETALAKRVSYSCSAVN